MNKKRVCDLAFFGGKPLFRKKLHVGCPNTCDKKILQKNIVEILESHRFTNQGPKVQELEKNIAEKIGVKHCIATCNGTAALEIAERALKLKGEVITPSFTFIATPHSLKWQGITPVFCDIDPSTHNINPKKIEELITPNTSGIVGVHVWGRPCDIDAVEEIAKKHKLKLIFDASHAFGNSYKGRLIGGRGNAEVFSFHATKFFNTMEGGAVVTNDDDLAQKIRYMKNFGLSENGYSCDIGINGKMSEVAAATGIAGWNHIPEYIAKNKVNYKKYQKGLNEIPGVKMVSYDENEACNYQYIVLEVDESKTHLSRNQIMEILFAENIMVKNYFHPGCHKREPYISEGLTYNLVETEKLCEKILLLPSGAVITGKEISLICEILGFIVEKGDILCEKMDGL